MADALAAVKKDLGRHAVILHTRQIKSGGFLGLKRRTLVEITASDSAPKGDRKSSAAPEPKSSRASASERVRTPMAAPGVHAEAMLASLAAGAYKKSAGMPVAASTAADREPLMTSKPAAPPPQYGPPPVVPARSEQPLIPASASHSAGSTPVVNKPPAPGLPASPALTEAPVVMAVRQRRVTDAESSRPARADLAGANDQRIANVAPGQDRLFAELADIKLMVNQVLQTTPPGGMAAGAGGAAGSMPEALFKQYLRLLEAAVSRDIADAIVGAVRDELSPAEMCDEQIVRTTVLRHLAALIPVAEQASRAPVSDGRPFTIALVGPTGVGKTTTIAKLAAAYKLRQGRSVAMITSDTYRIAAVDQLRTYASILGVPLKVVMTPAEMDAAVRSLCNFDVVLIDTAGRSQNAKERLRELSAFLEAASPHETHMVLSSTASEGVLMRTAQSFADAGIVANRLILSKLDEAVNFGVVVNVAKRLSARLSFVTTGQEVPDHIEAGRPDRLARMILDNSLGSAPGVHAPGGTGRPGLRVDAERAELLGVGVGEGAA